jgi:hypothetical protein
MKRAPAAAIPIDRAILDKHLLGAALGDPQTWAQWLAVLRAAFALPMSDDDRTRFHAVAGDRDPPSRRVDELWAVLGRRAGKTRVAAALSVHIGAIETHALAPGETGFVLLLASSKSQASIAFRFIVGMLEASPILRQQIENVTANEVLLKGNIVIGVHANSFRTVRGRTILAVVFDEVAFWRDETTAQPDIETYRAVIPALAARNGMLIGISTGYRKIGLLHQKHHDHFGKSGDDVLVIQGPTATFNPTIKASVIDKAMASDPEAAASEWGGGFRDDISAFLDDATVDAAIDHARPLELPPRGLKYVAFSDASGGRHDAFTLAIAHAEGERFIVDVVRGTKPPFDPSSVVATYAALLKEYGIGKIRADNYAAAWVETAWQAAGIKFERSEVSKSQLYLETLPLFVRQVVSLPDHAVTIRELKSLERRTARSGKDSVDHPRNGHDDHANSVAGVLHALAAPKKKYAYDTSMAWADDYDDGEYHASRLRSHIFSSAGGGFYQ